MGALLRSVLVLASCLGATATWAQTARLELYNQQGLSVAPGLMLNTDVKMQAVGLINQVKVVQHFRNDNPFAVNGRYVFPLPDESAVYGMTLKLGERRIRGVIDKKAEAERTYQQAKAKGKKAALVRQQRANMFVTDVANIEPGQMVSVELSYQETLSYADGVFSIRFPTTITPRYHPMVMQLNQEGDETSQQHQPSGWLAPLYTPVAAAQPTEESKLSLTLDLQLGLELAEVSAGEQEFSLDNPALGHYQLDLQDELLNKDIVLSFRPRLGGQAQAALITQQTNQGDNYGLVMLVPPADSFTASASLPRETVFVIDTSGSMHGKSMDQAKQALLYGLTLLDKQDSFNIIGFDNRLSFLSLQSLAVNPANLALARGFVHSLEADGGTEIAQALDAVLDGQQYSDRVRQVVFLTDGSVSNEAALFAQIQAQLGGSRLFTVGIGSAPNSLFMTRAADTGRGAYTFIGNSHEVQDKMQHLFNALQHPAIADLSLSSAGQELAFWPNPLPDLYFGQPLMVAVKLPSADAPVSVQGQTSLGPLQVNLMSTEHNQGDSIARLWARQQIKSLLLYHPQEQVKQQVQELALAFQLLSPFTAFVAVDDTPGVTPAARDAQVVNALPDGGPLSLPQTGGASHLYMLLGMILLACGAGGMRWIR